MNYNALRCQITLHEGVRLKPYRDIFGKLTIGVGRNLDDNGISHDEAMFMLDHDLKWVSFQLILIFPNFALLPENIQLVFGDMMFNLGPDRFKGFKRMIEAGRYGDYAGIKREMMDSKWFHQVGSRGEDLVYMVEQVINANAGQTG